MGYDDYFKCKPDVSGKNGLCSYQKCTAVVQMLAYGVMGDLVDEYTRMSDSTCLETMWEVMTACVIMDNKIVEDEHDARIYDQGWDYQGALVEPEG
jgi:hypothetical protein